MSINNLPVIGLDFSEIKFNLTSFYKNDNAYKDYNFEASGLSALSNILAYDTHMKAFYTKMLLDESFIDSAHKRESLLSHAKRTGYTPKSARASRAQVSLTIELEPAQLPTNEFISIPRGTSFSSTNNLSDTRVFWSLDDTIARNRRDESGKIFLTTEPITVYEGQLRTWRFLVDSTVVNQNFVLKDKNADIDTIRVSVREADGSTKVDEFFLSTDIDNINATSNVFYLTTNEDGNYQFLFGDGVFGKKLSHGNQIEVMYVATTGVDGNGAKNFQFNAPAADLTTDFHVGNFSDFTVETLSQSSGGMKEESIDSLRFTIPNHWRRQNRLVTVSDYKSILMEKFRFIESINVWGGEEHWVKTYGKTFISIKPYNGQRLTQAAKNEIRKIVLDSTEVTGSDIVFVDPNYIVATVSVIATIDRKKTNRSLFDIESDIMKRVVDYNNLYLNKFNGGIKEIDLLNSIRADDVYISGVYTEKVLEKDSEVMFGGTGTSICNFANPITTASSSAFEYGGQTCRFVDKGDGTLSIVSGSTVKVSNAGSINYSTGKIDYRFPQFARISGYTGSTGIITFTANARNPDIKTALNNIVIIKKTRVKFDDLA